MEPMKIDRVNDEKGSIEKYKGIDTREEGKGRKPEPGEDDASETASRRLGACFPTTDLRDFPTTRDNLCPNDE